MKSARWVVLMLVILVGSARADEKGSSTQAATEAANAWLALIDHGKYDESWKTSAAFFRSKVPADAWKKQIEAARGMVGAFRSRKLKSAQPFSSLPGAPDGKYVVIQYDASFEKKKDATETITPALDPDGKWRVSGYFIQ